MMPAERIAVATEGGAMEKSLYLEGDREMDRHKWIESQKAGRDLGEQAVKQWVKDHWCGYLRARWIEHLEGVAYWTELGRNDFGLVQRCYPEHPLLLDRIVDRLKAGQENLHIINWAIEWNLDCCLVRRILETLDVNGKRLSHRFDS